MINSLQPDAVLYDQRHKEYIRLVTTRDDGYFISGGVKMRSSDVEGHRWVYRKHKGSHGWTQDTWTNLECQLKVDCRVVGRIEALVVLGIKL